MAEEPDKNNARTRLASLRDHSQSLRIQRTAFAALASLGVIGVIAMLAWTGLLATRWFFAGAGAIALQCMVFLGLMLGGVNKRFRDPSMTIPQMFGAALTLLMIAHAASPAGRSVVMMLIPLAFAFATFRFGFLRLMRYAAALVMLMSFEAAMYLRSADPLLYPPANALLDLGASMLVLFALAGIGGQVNDLRSRTRAERALSHVAMGQLNEAVITVDHACRVQFANPAAEAILGCPARHSIGVPIDDLFPFESQQRLSVLLQRLGESMTLEQRTGDAAKVFERTLQADDGTIRHLELSISGLGRAGTRQQEFVLVVRDVSESHRLMVELKHAARHDALTGLLNRSGFVDALNLMLGAHDPEAWPPCVLAIDLDEFKILNDVCGHKAGDELLCAIGQLLQRHCPRASLLARLGGDEFAVALRDMPLEACQTLAEQLILAMRQLSFVRDDRQFRFGGSIGIAQFSNDRPSGEVLVARADAACLQAKQRGRNRAETFLLRDEERIALLRDTGWAERLSKAIDEDRFVLYAQKISAFDAAPEDPDRYEMLVRLPDGDGRVIAPAAFLAASERFNLAVPLDRCVLRLTARSLQALALAGRPLPEVTIKLSSASLRDPGTLDFLGQTLANHGVEGRWFTVEFTEAAALVDVEATARFVAGLKAPGRAAALD
ncbi:MAG: diguanylate cyclase [Burkholderiaceae bacterium]